GELFEGALGVVERREYRGGGEDTDVQVRRNGVVEAADRSEELRRAVADEVPREPDPRRPLVREGERLEGAGEGIRGVVLLRVVADPGVDGEGRQCRPLRLKETARAPGESRERHGRNRPGVALRAARNHVVLIEDLERLALGIRVERRERQVADA